MRTVKSPEHSIRTIVRGAWFECFLYRLADETAVLERVKTHRDVYLIPQYKCAAYILDAGKTCRSDGDGDPVSGEPMLGALRGHGLSDVLAIVNADYPRGLLPADDRVPIFEDIVTRAIDAAGAVPLDRPDTPRPAGNRP